MMLAGRRERPLLPPPRPESPAPHKYKQDGEYRPHQVAQPVCRRRALWRQARLVLLRRENAGARAPV